MPSHPPPTRLSSLISPTAAQPIQPALFSLLPPPIQLTLFSLLPPPTLLALRRVSRTTKSWVESLHIPFPTADFVSPVPTTTLHRIAPLCRALTVHLQPAGAEAGASLLLPAFRALPEQPLLPRFRRLVRLRVVVRPAPVSSGGFDGFYGCEGNPVFEGLLALRLFLQSADVRMLEHIAVENFTVQGILAFRWGPFSCFGDADWGGGGLWRGLVSLEATLVPWWRQELLMPMESREEREKRVRVEWRDGLKILHDWIGSFAKNDKLEKLRFEWVGTCDEGPNPLLLDQVANGENHAQWFHAQPIKWRACSEVWLGGVLLAAEDVEVMKNRMPTLEKVMVWKGFERNGVSGEIIVVEKKKWMVVQVERIAEHKETVESKNELESIDESNSEEGEWITVGMRIDEGVFEGSPVEDVAGSDAALVENREVKITVGLDPLIVEDLRGQNRRFEVRGDDQYYAESAQR